MQRLRWTIAALCAVAVVATGCGDDGGEGSAATAGGATAAEEGKTSFKGKEKPEVALPDGPPPKKLVVTDLEVGKGPTAKVGDTVQLQYVGINWLNRPFSDSWTYSTVPTFELGDHRLEYGLDLGIRGMRPGGRREVIVPPDLIYWPGDSEPDLGPSNTLVFVVDLFEVR